MNIYKNFKLNEIQTCIVALDYNGRLRDRANNVLQEENAFLLLFHQKLMFLNCYEHLRKMAIIYKISKREKSNFKSNLFK